MYQFLYALLSQVASQGLSAGSSNFGLGGDFGSSCSGSACNM